MYEVFAVTTAGEGEIAVLAAIESLTSYYYTGFDFLVLKEILGTSQRRTLLGRLRHVRAAGWPHQ